MPAAAQVEAIAAPLIERFKGSDPQFHILTPLGMKATLSLSSSFALLRVHPASVAR